jgi:hypothetical protein
MDCPAEFTFSRWIADFEGNLCRQLATVVEGTKLSQNPSFTMHMILPMAAAGYSLVYLLAGGGLGGAVLIFIGAKLLGR